MVFLTTVALLLSSSIDGALLAAKDFRWLKCHACIIAYMYACIHTDASIMQKPYGRVCFKCTIHLLICRSRWLPTIHRHFPCYLAAKIIICQVHRLPARVRGSNSTFLIVDDLENAHGSVPCQHWCRCFSMFLLSNFDHCTTAHRHCTSMTIFALSFVHALWSGLLHGLESSVFRAKEVLFSI